jgi:uncharacterized membrane protein
METYREPRISAGSVIKRSLKLAAKNFVPLFLIGAVTSLPTLLSGSADPMQPVGGKLWLGIVLGSVFAALCQAMVVAGTIRALTGKEPRFVESSARALRRSFPVLVAYLLLALICALGILLLIVPGLIAFAALAVVVPVCVMEDLRPLESLSRSCALTAGSRWNIFWVQLLTIIAAALVGGIGSAALHGLPLTAQNAFDFVWGAVISSYSGVLAAVIYYDLRVAKENASFD